MIFGSQSKGFLTGTEGNIVYRGPGFDLKAYWDNPYIGSNSSDLQITGDNANNYRTNKECGSGNKSAHMRYEVYAMEIHLVAPEANTTVSGPLTLTAQAKGVLGVAFKAYYATDPKEGGSWHFLGAGTQQSPGEWSFLWNSASIPDQGTAGGEIVTLCAYATDAQGNELAPQDSCRVNIKNNVGFIKVKVILIDDTHWRVDAVDTIKGPITNGEVRVNGHPVGTTGQSLSPRPRVLYVPRRKIPKGEVRVPNYPKKDLDLSHVWIDKEPDGDDLSGLKEYPTIDVLTT